ncbi:MAG: IS3 family transposase [Eubacteriaceae bacterium]|nr:IS3 family transposase [Eubacteriaceae bacterium]
MLDKTSGCYSIKEQCGLLSLNRTSIYYKPKPVSRQKLAVLNRIGEIYTLGPAFGGAATGTILRREGHKTSDPTVRKYMAEMGLRAVYPGPSLSRRAAAHKVYPYLLKDLETTVPNQVWGAGITYIRMESDFLYLVAYMGWFSRYVVPWGLPDNMETDFVLRALRRGLKVAVPGIANPDQGSQSTDHLHVGELLKSAAKTSMDGKGRCMGNIFTERLWRSLKYQEAYLEEYETPRGARAGIRGYFELYNTFRPRQGIGGLTPHEAYFGKAASGLASAKAFIPRFS